MSHAGWQWWVFGQAEGWPGQSHQPSPPRVGSEKVCSQSAFFLFWGEASADLLTCEHPTSDSAFSSPETAESPEGSPSRLLLPCIPG